MTKEQVAAYDVNPNTPVSKNGGPWTPLYAFPELMEVLQRKQSARAYSPQGPSGGYSSELSNKKTLCGIMAIIFGYLGIQYFLVGKIGGGIITILLSAVTCGGWSVITLIQGILILCMSDSDFKRKYIDSTTVFPLF